MTVHKNFSTMSYLKSLSHIETYRYGVRYMKDEWDPWVEDALRLFDPDMYARVSEYSKRGATVPEVQKIVHEVCSEDRSWAPKFDSDEWVDWERAKQEVLWDFSVDGTKVQPLTVDEAMEDMYLGASAGYGYRGLKKWEVVDDIRVKAKQRELECRMGRRVDSIPATIGTRGHLHHKKDSKRRITYNFPAVQIVLERLFSVPITERQKENPDKAPMFFGTNLLNRLVRLLEKDFGLGSQCVQTDISRFDRDVLIWTLEQVFEIIEGLIDFEHWNGKPVSPAEQKRYKRVFFMVKEYFIYTPLMTPEGELIVMEGGVCSGSAFTQLVDSLVNALIMNFLCKREGHGIYEIKVLGDDVKLDIAGYPDLDRWALKLLKWFNMTLSVKKSHVYGRRFRQKRFLGYDVRNGFLVRDRLELFNLAAHPENDVKSLVASCTRMVAYMMLGGIHDLQFSRFFEFYQSCYPIPDAMPELDYDLDTKRMYAGFEMPMKPLTEYTVKDFRWGLFR